jgi:hypothetical protein
VARGSEGLARLELRARLPGKDCVPKGRSFTCYPIFSVDAYRSHVVEKKKGERRRKSHVVEKMRRPCG